MYQDVVAGGFVTGKAEDGTPVIRNPATQPVLELLDNVLALTRLELSVALSLLMCQLVSYYTGFSNQDDCKVHQSGNNDGITGKQF